MENENSEVADKLLEMSIKLNRYIKEYREQAVLIETFLVGDDEESLFKIKDVLNRREALIKSYDQTALELKREQTLHVNDNVISVEVNQKLSSLEQERQAIFNAIREIESRNMDKISNLYNDNRGHIKQIEEGKKLMNAYHTTPQVTDGMFFDRRK
jgi:hypothetical protein